MQGIKLKYACMMQDIPQSIYLWITRQTVSTAGKSDNCTTLQRDMMLKGFDQLSLKCQIFCNDFVRLVCEIRSLY